MQDNSTLLRLLNNVEFHSGTELGRVLGISRVAVQKRIQRLIDAGLPIQALHGKGYRLMQGITLLDSDKILSGLPPFIKCRVEQLHLVQTVESTSSYLLQQPIGLGKARVCIAEAQTQGRGRRDNQWVSQSYRNIMMSLSWRFSQWPETITGLGLAASLVVAERLNELFGLDVRIKWPNDLLLEGKKLAGILVEVSGEPSGDCKVVVGLGLNVDQRHDLPQPSDYGWQDLGCAVDRNQLVAFIIQDWVDMLDKFDCSGFELFRGRWNALSSFAQRDIEIKGKNLAVSGVMVGVDNVGALLVEDKQGLVHRFVDSSVSVRLQ